ncbi:glycoside hydrolase family 47 protein [Karstenula rhodostoma CBS 690.94]|uniref:alpha-1,2-Mannosidase n=1 Tax=Karstenula rhodostoma CBS 690.94 TaxID=1392251 RepID=A0A9P4PFZ0_9PLEO|nr:glycoside hydrolase family 47 protein [Karstenula rhodostoma CBS 690.94]
MPRRMAPNQPLSRRHKRNLSYAFVVAFVFAIVYVFNGRPGDPMAVSFVQHEAYMNDRANTHDIVVGDSYDWRTAPFVNTISDYIPLPVGTPKKLPKVQFDFPPETSSQRAKREARRVAVRQEFQRSWENYRTFAWGQDELAPITGQGAESFGGWGATLVDALDTLWIMGLKDDFYEAVEAVAAIDFGVSESVTISVFETTIRYLGGLLSAYDLSHEKVLLEKAIQLGEMLYRAFDTTPNNFPLDRLLLENAKNKSGSNADSSICFAALGSLTMEFTRLAQVTQKNKYYDVVAKVTNFLDRAQNETNIPGLFPIWINAYRETIIGTTFTAGAMADSSYEYFPKMVALLGGLEPIYEKLWKDSSAMIDKHMLFRPMLPDTEPGKDLLFSGDVTITGEDVKLDAEMQHLTCFIGGMFALGGRLMPDQHHVDLGAKLTEGCIYAYAAMPSGIMPEIFDIASCASRTSCPWNVTSWEEEVLSRSGYNKEHADFEGILEKEKLPPGFTSLRDKRYLLRPEAIESVMIMYRITGHEEYLDHAWDMFTSVVRATQTPFANGQVFDVTADPPAEPENKMESFWFGETLKYFYLVFSPPDMISLDEWVFNTEAHPFRRPESRKTGTRGN